MRTEPEPEPELELEPPGCAPVPAPGGAGRAGSRTSRSRHHRNAASVLPLPVGAWRRTWPPSAIAAQPSTWAGVGAAKASRNQVATGGLNRARGSATGLDRGATGAGVYARTVEPITCSNVVQGPRPTVLAGEPRRAVVSAGPRRDAGRRPAIRPCAAGHPNLVAA